MASRCSSPTAALACLILAAAAAHAQGPPSDGARAAASNARAEQRIRALQKESEALASQEKTLIVELRQFEVQRELKSEELAAAQRDLTVTQATLAQTLTRAAALRDVAEKERPDVNSRLVQLYKLGRAGYWRLLLDLDSVQSIGRAYRTASALGRLDRERVQQHQRTLTALAAERRALETHARDIARLKEQAANARAAMDRAVAARKTLVDSIDARRDLNAQLTGELEPGQQRLQGAVATLGGAPAVSVSLPLRPFRGVLPWPATGIVTGRFGVQTVNRFGATISRNGVEISIAEGKPVRAIHEGLVAYAEPFTGYGNLVIIDHGDGAFSLYGNLASLGVSRGERVDQQAPVGTSGRNPSGNPALYFELRVDGKPVDPLQWLKR
ncbi:MAG: peptidoglycan DD-metalloendopeptidase family protein [Acidobacteriota bacterium]